MVLIGRSARGSHLSVARAWARTTGGFVGSGGATFASLQAGRRIARAAIAYSRVQTAGLV